MQVQSFYNTRQIEDHYRGYGHWFDADSKRFFNSRIGVNAYPTANPFITLFVSSERCSWNDYYDGNKFIGGKRKYSIRSYDSRTHEIDTVGEFQAYNSSKTANSTAKKLAKEWQFNLEDMHEYALILNTDLDQQNRRNMGRNKIIASQTGYLYVANVGV